MASTRIEQSLIDQFELMHKRFQELDETERKKYCSLKTTIKQHAGKDFDRITGVQVTQSESPDGLTDEQRAEFEDLFSRMGKLTQEELRRYTLLEKIKNHFEKRNKEKQIEQMDKMRIDDPVKALAEVVYDIAGALEDILFAGTKAKAKAIKNSFHG